VAAVADVPASAANLPRPLKMPDVTPAQIVTIVTAATALAVALGVPLSHDKTFAITTFVTVLAPVLVAADAVIRHGRARYVAAAVDQLTAGLQAAQAAGLTLPPAMEMQPGDATVSTAAPAKVPVAWAAPHALM